MFTHERSPRARRRAPRPTWALRGALAAATATVLVAASALPAAADVPVAWDDPPQVSVLGFLLVLLIIPVGLALAIALLSVLPSLARDKGYEEGATWRGEPQWFGSPSQGVSAADDVTPEQLEAGSKGSGGTSGSW